MIYYKTNTSPSPQFHGGHVSLIGPPLVITLLFCFSLVIFQPAPQSKTAPAASHQSTPRPVITQPQLADRTFTSFVPLAPLPESSAVHPVANPLQATAAPPATSSETVLATPATPSQPVSILAPAKDKHVDKKKAAR